jgi:S-formylglutathione hydrolase FrmB
MLEPVFGRDPAGWRAREPATLVRRLLARGDSVPALRVDVGVDDRYLAQSRHFAASLREAGVPVEYAEHPGKHDWVYWRTHVPTSLAWLGTRMGGR